MENAHGVLPDGMAQRSDGACWNPRPGNRNANARKDYHAGYSDGFYAARFGSAGIHASEADYRTGFSDGRADNSDVA